MFIVAGLASLAAALVFIGLLIWGAIGDGRDQHRRRDASRRP